MNLTTVVLIWYHFMYFQYTYPDSYYLNHYYCNNSEAYEKNVFTFNYYRKYLSNKTKIIGSVQVSYKHWPNSVYENV